VSLLVLGQPSCGLVVEWGRSACWHGSSMSFRLCCRRVVNEFPGHPSCFHSADSRRGDFESCCRQEDGRYLNHAALQELWSLEGCEDPSWDIVLMTFYLDGGGRDLMSWPQRETAGGVDVPYWANSASEFVVGRQVRGRCALGQLLVLYWTFMQSLDGTAAHAKRAALHFAAIHNLIAELEEELSSLLMFDLTSMTFDQMRYVLAGVASWLDLPMGLQVSLLPRFRLLGTVVDLGCAGGLDALIYGYLFTQVLAVDAAPQSVQDARELLANAPNTQVLQKAIVSESIAREANSVPFYVDVRRPDLSSAREVGAPRSSSHVEQHDVQAISCTELFLGLADLTYVKMDLEGEDVSCLRDLKRNGMVPPLLSLELPCLHVPCARGKEDMSAIFEVLELLFTLGYRHFKLVAQSPLNMRCWPNRCGIVSATNRSFTMAGPPGPIAVDIEVGVRWRALKGIIDAIPLASILEATAAERFDIHVAYSTSSEDL